MRKAERIGQVRRAGLRQGASGRYLGLSWRRGTDGNEAAIIYRRRKLRVKMNAAGKIGIVRIMVIMYV